MLPFIFIVLQGISKVKYLCSFISISKLNHWPIRFQTVTSINELQTLVSLFFVKWIHSTIKAIDWLLYISSFSTLAFKLLLHVNQFFLWNEGYLQYVKRSEENQWQKQANVFKLIQERGFSVSRIVSFHRNRHTAINSMSHYFDSSKSYAAKKNNTSFCKRPVFFFVKTETS